MYRSLVLQSNHTPIIIHKFQGISPLDGFGKPQLSASTTASALSWHVFTFSYIFLPCGSSEVVFCSSIAFSKSLQKFFYPNLGVLCLVEPYKSTRVGSAPRTPNGSPDCALLATENANGHPTEIVFWDHSVPSRFSSKHHCNLQRIPSTEILATKILA